MVEGECMKASRDRNRIGRLRRLASMVICALLGADHV